LLRPPGCGLGARYREAEDRAIRERRGLWGERAEAPAFAAAGDSLAAAAGPPVGRGGGGGCRLR
ncbi:MAG: hypothetical protein R3190_06480, partial [Thermoanaerobaculia bacterium]|nr:hypothetical protein [Thermoanaerobaculia bacterium]